MSFMTGWSRLLTVLQTGAEQGDDGGFLSGILDMASLAWRIPLALLILLMGVGIAYVLAGRTRRFVRSSGFSEKVVETPLGPIFGDRQPTVERVFGALVKYYVYLVVVTIGARIVRFESAVHFFDQAAVYAPLFIAGFALVTVGAVLASGIGDRVAGWEAIADSSAAQPLGTVVEALIYYVAAVIALDFAGFDTTILVVFGAGIALAVGLAVAIAVGVAVGLGSKEYVENHVDEWASESAPKEPAD